MNNEEKTNQLTPTERRDITLRLRTELALLDLPEEEDFPPVYPAWKTYASFRHINALAAGWSELWAASWGGVVRWRFESPVKFTRFASEHGLPGHRFHCLALDGHGHPWVGGPQIGLSTFDGERWKTFTTQTGLPSDDVLCLSYDPGGRLWAGTGKGLGYISLEDDPLRWHKQILDTLNLPADEIQALAVGAAGTLWLGTDWGLYQRQPDGSARRYTEQDGLPCLQITHLALSNQGQLWIGTAAGLAVFSNGAIEPCPELPQAILGLTLEPNGTLWVITSEGIGAYTPEGWQPIKAHTTIADSAQGRAMAANASGQRWFGYTDGLTQEIPSQALLSKEDFNQMTKGENSLDNCITALQIDAIGRLWVGTPTGLWYQERDTWRQCRSGNELSTPLINVRAMALSPRVHERSVGEIEN
jgi:ligand-binding sensor domain-containing protein